ncbi:MAG TPA: DUF427 domain-containing protein [Caulobacter sp.]|nr:DUF427 domain-containing protein [Caulobacter sp.]
MTESRLKFAAAQGRVRALFEGHEIADSANALILTEEGHDPVVYFPAEDVATMSMRKTDRTSHCPYKGQASYYTIYRDRQIAENAAWSYEDPLEGAELIRGRIAFYPEHVDIQMGDQGTNNAAAPDNSSPDTPRPGGELKTFSSDGNDAPFKVPPHDPPYADMDPRDRSPG